jgi:photosystem II protein
LYNECISAACVVSLATAFAPVSRTTFGRETSTALCAEVSAEIQFVRGLTEKCVPNVRLTQARDGSSGVATFSFDNPNVFDGSTAAKGITGMFMLDEEGEISTTSVNARFANGKPQSIESTYVMNSPQEW